MSGDAAAYAAADPAPHEDVTAAADQLVASLMAEPWGQVSPSVYETGRLVTLAPWLVGHDSRIELLLASQRPDGGWGGPDGYGLVPTLSATEAMLATLHRAGADASLHYGRLVEAAGRGLHKLFGWLNGGTQPSIVDTPAVEIIVPALVASINDQLDQLRDGPVSGLDAYLGGQLQMPTDMDGRALARIRTALASGASVPEKLFHSLEVA